MALKVSGFDDSAASYKVVNNTDSDENVETNVTGSSGTLYAVDIVNGGSTHTSYTKFKLTSGTVTVGTTQPDMLLVCKPNTSETYQFPTGLSFEQLTFWTTRNGEATDSTAPNTTTVTLLCT